MEVSSHTFQVHRLSLDSVVWFSFLSCHQTVKLCRRSASRISPSRDFVAWELFPPTSQLFPSKTPSSFKLSTQDAHFGQLIQSEDTHWENAALSNLAVLTCSLELANNRCYPGLCTQPKNGQQPVARTKPDRSNPLDIPSNPSRHTNSAITIH